MSNLSNLNQQPVNTVAFPWSNTRVFAESLKSGDLCLPNAISQVNAVLRETLRIIEDFASDQIKSNSDRKSRLEKMDKIVTDLGEKCQGLQQALLYKEEKYDEKCREVERYKVICELSANKATQDNFNFINQDDSDDQPDIDTQSRKHIKTHTKLSKSQTQMKDRFDPLQPLEEMLGDDEGELNNNITDYRVRADGNKAHQNYEPASSYVGGPCKRKLPTFDNADLALRDKMATMGAINSKGPKIRGGPVPLNEIMRPSISENNNNYTNNRVKVALFGQRNEVMSSSRNAVNQINQKFTERDLHRQVASGCWNRLSGRRKKDWPF